ncbi:Hypothetical predicted protein [Pelobates cultripes]|uniref:Uncharacterized protein n=1 Tax=Pelobates cultripes TaxID=61616 RepID=A0AAD1TJZ9_PELCU|nr:Hypothetical predicted protein [Pelobates cultripes]
MGKHSKAGSTPKPSGTRQAIASTYMRQCLAAAPDLNSQAASEAYTQCEASTPNSYSPEREEHAAAPPADWLSLLKALPTWADLTNATTALQTSIRADLQLMRADIQGMADRMAQIEADHDTLTATQATQAANQAQQMTQMQVMARHIEDLDNRGCRNNLRIRGLQEGEETPTQLIDLLTNIFNGLLRRPKETPIEFVRADRVLRPRDLPEAPPWDVICCLVICALKEEILHEARNKGKIIHEGQQLQLYPDLCPATLGYHRALKPLTRALVTQKIRYRWTFPTGLIGNTRGGPRQIRTAQDLQELLEELKLPPLNLRWPDPLDYYNSPPTPQGGQPQRRHRTRMETVRLAGATR